MLYDCCVIDVIGVIDVIDMIDVIDGLPGFLRHHSLVTRVYKPPPFKYQSEIVCNKLLCHCLRHHSLVTRVYKPPPFKYQSEIVCNIMSLLTTPQSCDKSLQASPFKYQSEIVCNIMSYIILYFKQFLDDLE